jgi:pheromone shutdown protein TraB
MSDTVTRMQLGEREFVIVGTAHISKESTAEVQRIIQEEKPDRVCLELDDSRYRTITQEASW